MHAHKIGLFMASSWGEKKSFKKQEEAAPLSGEENSGKKVREGSEGVVRKRARPRRLARGRLKRRGGALESAPQK